LHEGFQGLVMFRPQAFSASRRFTPRRNLRACFVSQPCPGHSLVQGLLSQCSRPSSSDGSCPPCRWLRTARRSRTLARTFSTATIQGADSEALLRTKTRSARVSDQPSLLAAPLFEFALLQVFRFHRRPRLIRDHPLMKSSPERFACALLSFDLLQRFRDGSYLMLTSPFAPTCSRFRAFLPARSHERRSSPSLIPWIRFVRSPVRFS